MFLLIDGLRYPIISSMQFCLRQKQEKIDFKIHSLALALRLAAARSIFCMLVIWKDHIGLAGEFLSLPST